jgi:long-chain acyl-CoA synthetase
VGSAPSNEKLLLSYRDIGIEVHNAYGLTEAPLVTMNRLGKNHIGTVGQPLPKTELKQAEDGELLVKGPQVMQGYLNENKNKILENGWLHTGDLGRINENGDLVIYGRKKEVIATSYGKKISIFKIESMLKTSEGVDEVMLIGEGKPYVSALIWSNQAEQQPSIVKSIKKGLTEVNNNLSRAEKIRTWVILKNDLGVESGDLTPNFKLKRHNISIRFANIIDSLYNSKFVTDPRIIHSGRI